MLILKNHIQIVEYMMTKIKVHDNKNKGTADYTQLNKSIPIYFYHMAYNKIVIFSE